MKKIILYSLLVLALISCTTIKEITKTEYITKVDTVKVLVPQWADSTHGFWEDTTTVTGVFIDSIKKDTILVVKYRKADTVFTAKIYPDTLYITKVDTVQINTTTLTEEPTFLEQWWWLFLIIGVIVLVIFLRR